MLTALCFVGSAAPSLNFSLKRNRHAEMFSGMPSSSIVPEGIPRTAAKTSPLAFEIVGTAQHVGRCERGRIGDRVGGDVQRDALAGQQGDHAFGDGRLGIDLVDHAEQVAHVASGGNRKLHAAFNGLGGGFERVGGSGELLVDDLGRAKALSDGVATTSSLPASP